MKKWIVVLLFIYLMITEMSAQERQKPLVVLLPGLACPVEIYTPLVAELRSGFFCQSIDWTRAAAEKDHKLSIEVFVSRLIRELMEKVGADRLSLIGHSMGGWLALDFAARNPGMMDKLIVIDAVPFPAGLFQDLSPEAAQNQGRQLVQYLEKLDDDQYRAFDRQRISMMIENADYRQRVAQWFSAQNRGHLIRLMGEMASSDLRPLMHKVKARTLVLASGKTASQMGLALDLFTKRLQLQFVALADCSLKISEKAGHFIMIDDPAWMSKRIVDFLDFQ